MIYDYLPPIEGGIETHIHNLLKRLQTSNNVCFLTQSHTYDSKAYKNVKIFTVKKSRFTALIGLRYVLAGLRFAKSCRPHVVHAHTLGLLSIVAVILGLILRCPVVITVHESGFIVNVRSGRKRSVLMYRLILGLSKKVITTSEELRSYVVNISKKVTDVVEIPNGADLSLFNPTIKRANIRKKYGWKGRNVVLCPRRIVPKNGIIYLLEAIPEIIKKKDDVHFLFVGPIQDEKYWKLIHKRIKELNIEKYVIFTGGVPHTEMPKYYAISDIVVIPSLIEAISLSALEAMACKKPIVASAVGGLLEIIKDQCNGVLVKPADSEALAGAILLILNNKELASGYAENAYLTAKKFSWSTVAERTLDVYYSALKRK